MHSFRFALVVAASLALGGIAGAQQVQPPVGKPMTFSFAPQNGSGMTGTATINAKGNDTVVVIALKNAGSGPLPAHIHEGTCATLNPKPAFPLSNVVDGKSTSTVTVPLGRLFGKQRYAINVHKSTADIATYVSCADISPRNMPPAMASPGK